MLYAKSDDPKNVTPIVEAPPFVKVLDKSITEQAGSDGTGQSKVVAGTVVLGIDTRTAGTFEGKVKVRFGTVETVVPVSVVVAPTEPNAVKMLVFEGPLAPAPSNWKEYREWADLVAEAKWNVSNVRVIRGKSIFRALDLSKFDVVVLDGNGLLHASADDIKRARAFVEGGGKLVVGAQRFLADSVEAANKVLDGYGLKMLDEEAPTREPDTHNVIADFDVTLDKKGLAPELIKAGIGSAHFFRAAPVVVTDDRRARVLVKAAGVGGPQDGFVAVANAGKGEVVVLGQSCWYQWIYWQEAQGTDNAKLLRLLLTPRGAQRQ
jgi:hypothetical protein